MDKKEVIIDLLKKHPEGLSIENLSSMAKLDRNTIRVHLHELIGEGVINQRPIGNVKLNYWKFN